MTDGKLNDAPANGATDDHSSGDSTDSSHADDKSSCNFKISNATNANDNDYKLNLLETPRKSILGDTWICTEIGDKYYLDRAVLASKSNYLARQSEVNDQKVDMGTMIVNIVHDDNLLVTIIELIYGKDLKSVICESNFVELLKTMCHLEMQIDLDVFKEFIEKTIIPKNEVHHEMIKLYFFLLGSGVVEECNYECDYLLPTVSQYFSDRLLKAYKIKAFLSIPYDGLLRILLHGNKDGYRDKGLTGRICAEWICHDFEDRIAKLIKLVNATKHRYEIFDYCCADKQESIVNYVKQIDDNLRVQEVEKYFNELLHYHSDITFALGETEIEHSR